MEWLNYHHLFYFWTVMGEGSITAVTSKLRLAQSTVSTQLSKFKENLGAKLFKRVGRNLEPTDIGLLVVRFAAPSSSPAQQKALPRCGSWLNLACFWYLFENHFLILRHVGGWKQKEDNWDWYLEIHTLVFRCDYFVLFSQKLPCLSFIQHRILRLFMSIFFWT